MMHSRNNGLRLLSYQPLTILCAQPVTVTSVIFSTPDDVLFNDFKGNYEFMNFISDLYKNVEEDYNDVNDIARQVWHTPTELFKPYYGYSVADYLIQRFENEKTPLEHFTIYEVGAGNGTLMNNILDYIAQTRPDLYAITRYNIIEISGKLAEQQKSTKRMDRHHSKLQVINQSIFDWNTVVQEPCYFVAMEVIVSHFSITIH